jgi:uncharacterized protein (DUF2236 family)
MGPAAAHQHLPGRDHFRHGGRRPACGGPGPWHPPPGQRRGSRRQAVPADNPHLLEWVHIAEIDSFLLAHQLYGAQPLDQDGRDEYVADTARIAHALGVPDPPRTEAQLAERISAYRNELHGTDAAREAARFLLLTPPLPLLARVPYGVLASASVAMLPARARMPLRLPHLPPVEATGIRLAGRVLVGGIRWALTANQPEIAAVEQVSSDA